MCPFDLTVNPQNGSLDREWRVDGLLGAYASSTVTGLNTRKSHGLLVATMSPPANPMVLLSRVEETVVRDGWSCPLACNEYPGAIFPRGDQSLRAFSAEPFPRWAYQGDGWTVEKSLRLIGGPNTVVLSYALLGGDRPVDFSLRPMLALRPVDELMYQWNAQHIVDTRGEGSYRVAPTARTPEVFFAHDGMFTSDPLWYLNTIYRREMETGGRGLEDLWTPGLIRWSLGPGQTVHFVCSADPIRLRDVLNELQRAELAAAVPLPRTSAEQESGVARSIAR